MKLKTNKPSKTIFTILITTVILMNILAISLPSKSSETVENKDEIYRRQHDG